PGALPPALRGSRPWWWRGGPRRGDRTNRARELRRRPLPGGYPAIVGLGRDGLRRRRRDRRDGLRGAPARPAGPGRGYLWPEPPARPDAVLGERHAARRVLRGD